MKSSYRFVQGVQVIALLLGGLGNAVFAADVRAEQGFTKQAETVVKKPQNKREDDCRHHHHHHCKDEHHHSTTTAKKTDEKPTFSVTMKNDKKK